LKGTNGDIATVAITINVVRRVCESPPGLVTMRDPPIVMLWQGCVNKKGDMYEKID